MELYGIDIWFFILYCLVIIGLGVWYSFKARKSGNAESYFLAGKSLPFWVVGCSVIAANISAEQFIGMSGSGYAMGLAIAAYEWIAAIVSSLSAIINSASTIFTMDVYKNWINKGAGEAEQVRTGRIAGIVFTLIAAVCAPMLGSIDQVFQFIQKYTGLISPAITAIFILGIFSKKATPKAAFLGIIINVPLALAMEIVFPEMPFLDKMLILFGLISIIIMMLSYIENKFKNSEKAFFLDKQLFKTSPAFNMAAILIIGILVFIYIRFWN